MKAIAFSLALAASSLSAIAQNTSLIDPRTRFNHLNLSLPADTEQILGRTFLQQSFSTSPDCGETSYNGAGRLQGRRALVTGGDSGIGRAIVIAYLREGAQVAINYLPEEEPDAQDLADFVEQEGLGFTKITGDLMNETFCSELVDLAYEALGGLDILVNHAGFSGSIAGPNYRPISNHSTEQIERVFRTNVYASLFTTRRAVSLMPPGSSLIYTASDVARLPLPNGVDYSASKAALVSITRSLAVQLLPLGIRANAVAPGYTYTPFIVNGGYNTTSMFEVIDHNPMERIEQPAELAPVYVDLATADKTYVTGSIFGANGAGLGF